MPVRDKLLLPKQALIERVNNQLKIISQMEHTSQRRVWNFTPNLIAALCAYPWQPK